MEQVIKAYPADFIVEEIPERTWKDSGEYVVLRVKKQNIGTEEAADVLAKTLAIPRKNINYAGTKDKRAITTQYMSIRCTRAIKSFATAGCEFECVGYTDQPLALGSLAGNRFVIIVRKVTQFEKPPRPFVVPNLFGPQRFSTNNAQVGLAIVRKDFAKAAQNLGYVGNKPIDYLRALPAKTLLLYVHAYQSLIWNEFVKKENPSGPVSIIGFGTESDDPMVAFAKVEYGLTPRDFIIRQLPNLSPEGTARDSKISVEIDATLEEDKATYQFSLPKGSYATVVIEELRMRGYLKDDEY